MAYHRRYRPPILRKYLFGRRGLKLWPILIILAVLYSIGFDVGSRDDLDSLNQVSSNILHLVLSSFFFIFIFIAFYSIVSILRARKYNQTNSEKLEKSFRDMPWQYNRMVVELHAQVEYVFKNDFSYVLKRKVNALVRDLKNDPSHNSRHVHQRILLSSPQLRKGENFILIHNTKFGKLKLKKGAWILVKGEYIHDIQKNRSKKSHYYGKLHYSHEPVGCVNPLKLSKSEIAELSFLKVKVKKPNLPDELRQS